MRGITGIIGAVLFVCIACSVEDDGNEIVLEEREDIVMTKSQLEVLTSINSFSFDYFNRVVASNEYKNTLVSPLSLEVSLFMLANGAGEESYDSIVNSMNLSGCSVDYLNDLYSTLIKGLSSVDKSSNLLFANALWFDEAYKINPSYAKVIKTAYDADVRETKFSDRSSLKEIDKWVNERTNGMIDGISDFIRPSVMCEVNALYFKGIWNHAFKRSDTKKRKFRKKDGSSVNLDFMNQQFTYRYSKTSEGVFAELPLGNKAFSLCLFMPYDLEKLNSISYENISRADNFSYMIDVNMYIPKFSESFLLDGSSMESILKASGMTALFDRGVEHILESISPKPSIWQKTVFCIDESGAQGAATTPVDFYLSPNTNAPVGPLVVDCVFDRPFVYYLKETSTNAILFIGLKAE